MKKFFIFPLLLIALKAQSFPDQHKKGINYSDVFQRELKIKFLVHKLHLAVRLYDFSFFLKTIKKIEKIEKSEDILKKDLKHFEMWHVNITQDWLLPLKEFLVYEVEKEIKKLSLRCWFTCEPVSYFITPEMVKLLTAYKMLPDGKKATAAEFFSEETFNHWLSEIAKMKEYLESLPSG